MDHFEVTNSFIHGITNEKLAQDGEIIETVMTQLAKDVKRCKFFVGASVNFSLNILKSELFRLWEDDKEKLKVIDHIKKMEKTCVLEQSKSILKMPSNYGASNGSNKYKMPKLVELYKFCFNQDMPNHHVPEHDVMNVAKCFFHLLNIS
jgi:DNA polymerase III epsilon subunit-like protein